MTHQRTPSGIRAGARPPSCYGVMLAAKCGRASGLVRAAAPALTARAPTNCLCCGGSRLAKLGEDVTETLEVIPRRWKVIETVREKFTCRDCSAISQPPPPFHATPLRFILPQLLASFVVYHFSHPLPLHSHSIVLPSFFNFFFFFFF